jgi:hypothetical protein
MAARPDQPWLAFWLASISGLAEPIGAIFALLILHSTKLPLENVLASVAGVMCMVAVLELYPEAIRSLPGQGFDYTQLSQSSRTNDKLKQQQPKGRTLGNLVTSYRPIIWGTVLGIVMMVATEWYL